MPDEMFFSGDERGLVRGRRNAARTDTLRPCLIKLDDGSQVEGVIMNLNPHGMLVRLMGTIPIGTPVEVQMMRDETFQKPLAEPRYGMVVRHDASDGTFTDLGIKLETRRPDQRARRHPNVRLLRPKPEPTPREPKHMQTIDITMRDKKKRGDRRRS